MHLGLTWLANETTSVWLFRVQVAFYACVAVLDEIVRACFCDVGL